MATTRQLSRAILESGDLLRGDEYSFSDLCFIRDCLYGLDRYNLADSDLLREVEKAVEERAY